MIAGKLEEIVKVIDAELDSATELQTEFCGLSIDTRTIAARNIFVAIEGEVHDGHKFVSQAAEKGASVIIAERGNQHPIPENLKPKTVLVDDSKLALRQLGRWWKNKFDLKVVALTGTNGKTTTKEMIAETLAQKYKVFRTPGNFNNLYGIPLSLCKLDDSFEVAVLELGMSYPGEIETLTKLVNPDIALITNIGPAHLETMGSIENIAQAKFELLDNLRADALVILNLDDKILRSRFETEKHSKLGFAVNSAAEIKPAGFSSNSFGRMIFNYEEQEIHLAVPGLHNLYNALSACAVGRQMDIAPAEIKTALENYHSSNSRMQIVSAGAVTIIDDSYNANPTSMRFALQVLSQVDIPDRKIAILGDMRELGSDEVGMHQEVGRIIAELNPDMLITAGHLGMQIATGANYNGFDPQKTRTYIKTEDIFEFIDNDLHEGDCVLVKASRAMQFDKIVNKIKQHFGEVD